MDYRNILGTASHFKTEEELIPAYAIMWVIDGHPYPEWYVNAGSFLRDLAYYIKDQGERGRYPVISAESKRTDFLRVVSNFNLWSEDPTKYFGEYLTREIRDCIGRGVIKIVMRSATPEFALKFFRNSDKVTF